MTTEIAYPTFEQVQSDVMAHVGYDSYIDIMNECLTIWKETNSFTRLTDYIKDTMGSYLWVEDMMVWHLKVEELLNDGVDSLER